MVMETRCLLGVSRYAPTKQEVSQAKGWIRQVLDERVDDDTLYDISLCVVELVENARKHGPPDGVISVSVYMSRDTVRIEVADDGSAETVPHVTDNCLTEDGHGLQIVSALTKGWGMYDDPDLKQIVWCEFVRARQLRAESA